MITPIVINGWGRLIPEPHLIVNRLAMSISGAMTLTISHLIKKKRKNKSREKEHD